MTCDAYPNICIVQGQTYRQIFTAESNWSGAECRGQIRDNWLNSSGDIKAVFEFGSLTYDDETDLTTVEGVISHQQTTLLPATKYQGTGIQSVKNSLVYDIEIELGDNVYKLAPGYVQVIPEVSDDSVIYDPPVIWDGGIDSVELTETNGLVDTYTIWGDADKTINLGTFDVKNSEGVGIESANYDNSSGILTLVYTDGTEFETTDIRGEQGQNGVGIQSTEYDPLSGILTFTFTDNSTFSTGDLRADLDAATIKTRYESNDDTNAFTDAEKSKLESLEPGITNPIPIVYQSIQAVTYNQGGNSTMDNGAYNTFTLTADGTGTTIVHSNVPSTGNRYGFELHLTWTSGTITWPASWTKGDSKPTVIGNYVITGVTVDGGTSFKIAVLAE